ncbi:MAG: gliding motility-associated C-terminal domain-containing protein, partial [Bacteroidetes bacterium]|nr:gliding motility-associated C-terminal domain-containing protein [Bacteroidota bacterium]
AWILNIEKANACNGSPITPNITFSIETTGGVVIQTYNTGNIPSTLTSAQWKQYGFYFTLPGGTSDLVLRLTNNNPGGCGNDLALDDITFRPCGPKVDAAFANVSGNNGAVNFCISDAKVITLNGAVQTGYTNPAFQWQRSTDNGATWTDIPGATTTSYTDTYMSNGTFLFRLTAAEAGNIGIARCRVASNQLGIIIDSIPKPNATNSSPSCEGAPVNLSAANAQTYAWTGPAGFTAAVAAPVITGATPAQQGKYYVQVTTSGGCTARDSTLVTVYPLPPGDAGQDATICQGSSTMLAASGGVKYTWAPLTGLSNGAIANPVAAPDTTTQYIVQVYDQHNCEKTDTVKITVLKTPVAHAGPDKKIVAGQSVTLEGSASGESISWYWTPAQYINDAGSLTPTVSTPVDMTYTLHVSTANGCGDASDDVFIRVFQKVSVPNAFSPNGDGINDRWVIDGLDTYPESVTEVYNRYGQLVFRSRGYPRPWDGTYNGKPLPVGTYYYIIDRKNGFPLLSSWVAILR